MVPLVLFVVFLAVPIVEIYVIIQVGELIGGWPTVALLLAESLLGAWIVRREGRRAWRTLKETFARGVLPDRQLADAGLVLAGGVLLLTPGFVTDAAGFLFVLPFTRPLMRRLLAACLARRVAAGRRRVTRRHAEGGGAPPDTGPRVVRGEVVREDEDEGAPR